VHNKIPYTFGERIISLLIEKRTPTDFVVERSHKKERIGCKEASSTQKRSDKCIQNLILYYIMEKVNMGT
jgi:hypothetical protein